MGQADDLRAALPEYEWFGENRDIGEHTPIGVRRDEASIVDGETFAHSDHWPVLADSSAPSNESGRLAVY